MSLRVWLPLNGSLDNQGLDNYSFINDNVTFSSDGKMGQCAEFNGSNSRLYLNDFEIGNTWSYCMWFYNYTRDIAWTIVTILNDTGSDADTQFSFWYHNNDSRLQSTANTQYNSSIPTPSKDEWHHFCATFNGSTLLTYIDGSLVNTKTITASLTQRNHLTIGAKRGANDTFSYHWKGKINDYRIYDHALSEQEIKNISQGLIVHYPLNKNGWGQDNLLTNTHFDTRYSQTTGWDTTKNGTQLASSWGGYNGGVTNAGSVYHAHLKEVNDEYVYEFIKTANESWLGISQGGLNTKLTAGDTYTFSWEEYHVDGINRVGTGLYYYKEGATSANFHLGIQQASNATREIGRWQKFSYTFVAPSDADYTKSISWYIYGHYNGNGTFYVRHPKLEKNSSPTTWCPNVSDDLYNSLNVNNNTMYDISGFENNGTIHGTFSYITDTPLYKISTSVIGSGSNYLEGIVLPVEAKTVSLWVKCAKSVSSAIFNDKTTGLQVGLLNSLIYTNSKSSTAGFTTSHWINNDWNHVVVINDNGTRRCYVNGQSETQSGGSNYYIHNADKFWVWNRSYNNSYPYKGALSDLRIYATALSADEVKELYEHRNNI